MHRTVTDDIAQVSNTAETTRQTTESKLAAVETKCEAAVNEVKADVKMVSQKSGASWVALLQSGTSIAGQGGGNNFCPSRPELKLLGFGLVPGVEYALHLESLDSGTTKDTGLKAKTTMNEAFSLVYDLAKASTAWKQAVGDAFTKAPVRIVLKAGDATVTYQGVEQKDRITMQALKGNGVEGPRKVKIPSSQFVYAENAKHSIVNKKIPYDDTAPRGDEGEEQCRVSITPLHSDSVLMVAASLSATERRQVTDQNFVIAVSLNHKDPQGNAGPITVFCTGVEELFGDIRDVMQTVQVHCIVSNERWEGSIVKGKETEIVLRVGPMSGELCVNCVDDGYAKGGGTILSTLMVTEVGPEIEIDCAAPPKGVKSFAKLVGMKKVVGHESGSTGRTIGFGQYDHTRASKGNRPPEYGHGYKLHEFKHTPKKATNLILIEGTGQGVNKDCQRFTQTNLCVYAAFGTTKKAVVCATDEVDAKGLCVAYMPYSTITAQRVIPAGTTSEMTWSMHIGSSDGHLYYGSAGNSHRNNPGPIWGGKALRTTFAIREIEQVELGPNFFADAAKEAFTPMLYGVGYDGFNVHKNLGGSIPWGRSTPHANRGSRLGSFKYTARKADSVILVQCQAWMTELRNTADHSAVCIFQDNRLLSCGTEEDTRGQQRPHMCHARHLFTVSDTDAHVYMCRGGVNGGTATYNGGNQQQHTSSKDLGDTMWTQVFVQEIPKV